MTANNAASISVSSASKSIAQVYFYQTVTTAEDVPIFVVTQAPFSFTFNAPRLGAVNFAVIALFTDKTYAATTVNYTVNAPASPLYLAVQNAPSANVPVGDTIYVPTQTAFSNGPVDVTSLAKYSVHSGGSAVLSVTGNGAIKATGNGIDAVDVRYGGLSVSFPVAAGNCAFSVGPANALAPMAGGIVTLQVGAPAGCSWIGQSASDWLTLASATSGTGAGPVMVSAAPNNTGAARYGTLMVAGQPIVITQPATACSYCA